MDRDEQWGAALGALVAAGVLTREQAGAVVAEVAGRERARRGSRGRLAGEIGAYLGAGLVAAGLMLLLGRSWDELAPTGRVVTLLIVAGSAALGGVLLAGGGRSLFRRVPPPAGVRTRLASVLFVLAAPAFAGAVGAALAEDRVTHGEVGAAAAGFAVAALGYVALPSVLSLLATALGGAATVVGLGDLAGFADFGTGTALFAFGLAWFPPTAAGRLVSDWAGYLIAVVLALLGAQVAGDGRWVGWTVVYAAVVAVLCFALYVRRRELLLVLGGAGAVTVAVANAVDAAADGPGGALIVLAVGAVVLAAGGVVVAAGGAANSRPPGDEPGGHLPVSSRCE
ncbi:hypothetical protein [Nocardia thailandica]|uniref:hypothetical protein n=1 Tax=Nocardia thailandica TaxID=257275 RepID=UPI0002F67F2B|nr:hypothetical protein [Nocardia thailandica]